MILYCIDFQVTALWMIRNLYKWLSTLYFEFWLEKSSSTQSLGWALNRSTQKKLWWWLFVIVPILFKLKLQTQINFFDFRDENNRPLSQKAEKQQHFWPFVCCAHWVALEKKPVIGNTRHFSKQIENEAIQIHATHFEACSRYFVTWAENDHLQSFYSHRFCSFTIFVPFFCTFWINSVACVTVLYQIPYASRATVNFNKSTTEGEIDAHKVLASRETSDGLKLNQLCYWIFRLWDIWPKVSW